MASTASTDEIPRRSALGMFAKRRALRLQQLLVVIVVVASWTVLCESGWISREALPTPIQVAKALWQALFTADFWVAVGQTLRGAVSGLLLAALIGIPLGLLTGTYAAAERSSRLLVDVLRSFPVIALLPVFLLVMGSKPQLEITVVLIACVFPIFLQAQYGARDVRPIIDDTVRSFRVPRLLRFRKVVLPNATPSIMTGLRFAATTSVLVALGVELLTTLPGMGHTIASAQQNGNAPLAFAYIVTAGFLGWTINKCSDLLQDRLLAWRRSTREVV